MLKKLIVWSLLLIFLVCFYFLYQKPKEEEDESMDFLSKGRHAISLKEFNLRINSQGEIQQINLIRVRDYPKEVKADDKNKKAEMPLEERIKYLPAGFASSWELAQKPGMPLKEGVLAQLFSTFLTFKAKNVIKPNEQEPLSVYGLQEPERSVSVRFDDGSSIEMYISPLNSEFGVYYIRIDGDPNIYHVSEYDLEFLTLDVNKIHAENVFNLVLSNLEELKIKSGDVEYLISLTRLSDPRILKPFSGKASYKAIQDLYDELKSLVAEEWIAYGEKFDLAKFNLNNPVIQIIAKEKGGGSSISLSFNYHGDGKVAAFTSIYPTAIFRPSLDPIRRLQNYIANLREKKHFRYSVFDVQSFSVNNDRFVYRDGKWYRDQEEVESQKVERFLNTLKDLEALRFYDGSVVAQPDFAFSLKTNSEEYNCKFGGPRGDERFVECEESFVVSNVKFQEVLSSFEELKKSQGLPINN
ncbi:MAG: DUF4340 domain-containing protein [Deltaproteobacteria bacterium]|nr:DUF4340 domain-containing protein [Deltaproteobacteria bacterium]